MTDPLVLQLSRAQLDAYNRADVEAFCACYHEDVVVLGEDGAVTLRGIDAFRTRYAGMFAAHDEVHAEVDARILLSPHVVEHETWARRDRATGARSRGEVLVRYTERDGRIAIVAFLTPTTPPAP